MAKRRHRPDRHAETYRSVYPQRNWPDTFRRFGLLWLTGIATIAISIGAAAFLYQLGYFVGAVVVAVLCALTLILSGFWIGASLSKNENEFDDGGWMFGICLCGTLIAVAAAVVGQEEIVLTGSSARDVVAAEAPWSHASFLHFRNARVLTGSVDRVAVWSGSRGSHGIAFFLQVAPIVDAGWTPGQPIGAFAVLGSPTMGHSSEEWRQPLNGGIRVNAVHAEERATALHNFRADGDFNVAADPVFVRWSADPEGEAGAAWWRLVQALLIAAAFWTGTMVVGFFIIVTR